MYDNWKNAVLGVGLDIDHAEGNQCVDVAKSWAQVLFPQTGWLTTLGTGNAKDVFKNANPHYWEKIVNDRNDVNQRPQRGDIAVFAAQDAAQRKKGYTSKFDNPFGHVGVVDSTDIKGMHLVQQDGTNSKGKTFLSFRPWRYTELVGWLRPRAAAASAPPPAAPSVRVVNGVPQVDAGVVGKILYLKPHVDKWRVYPLGVKPVPGNEKNFVRPKQFGGLSYRIEATSGYPQVVTIVTQMFGRVNIFVDGDAEIR